MFHLHVSDLPNVSCQVLDACDIPDELASKFDLVMMVDVFHDLPYPEKLIQGLLKCLAPGGRLLLSDIDTLGDVKRENERGKMCITN